MRARIPSGIRTTATRTDAGWRIDGEKWFVTYGDVASVYIVMANALVDGEQLGTLFLIDRDTPGIEVVDDPPFTHNYPHGHPTIRFNGVEIGEDAIIGGLGGGDELQRRWFTEERLGIAARCGGAMWRLLEETTAWAIQREQGGARLIDHQGVAFPLADSAADAAAGRLLALEVARLLRRGRRPEARACEGLDGEAVLQRGGQSLRRPLPAGIRRPRVHAHERRGALLARAARRPHLGGHERGPADHHRPLARAPRRGVRSALVMPLGRLLRPASIAVVGATDRPGSYGGEALLNLQRLGYPGRVYAVNPRRERAHGLECHPSLASLPEVPDAVVVAIPAADVAPVIDEAGALGCGGAVVFAAGFAESAAGVVLQDDLVAAAARHALPVCGPNGNGIVCLPARAALWGDMVAPREPGAVALVSQSGNVAVNALASRRGLRLHTVVSCGNQAVLGAEDYLEALAQADGVRSVALYLEDDGDGERWCAALERCASAGVGVALLKAGSSAAGAAAAQAHTGAVAGDQRVFRALVEEAGAAWARDPHELLELAKALAVERRPVRAPGVAVMTCSGGDSSVAADLAQEAGLPLPELSSVTLDELTALLPGAATAGNPLDYTSLLWEEPDALQALVMALGRDPAIGRVLVLYDEPADMDEDAAASWAVVLGAVRAAAAASETPVVVSSTLPELLADASAASLIADGIPAIAGLHTGIRVAQALGAPAGVAQRLAAIGMAAAIAGAADGQGAWLAEHEAKLLLGRAGIAVPEGRLAEDADDAAAAQRELGGPVAMKLTSRDLRHKSEIGAYELGVETQAGARAAFERLRALDAVAGAQVLVERMAQPGVELIVSARADAVVPALVVGLGGVWTEALADVAVIPLPASPERVERALRDLRGASLLTGGRGRPALDVGAAARLAAAVGELLLSEGLALIELNPVIVGVAGAIAVDALVVHGAARDAMTATTTSTTGATP